MSIAIFSSIFTLTAFAAGPVPFFWYCPEEKYQPRSGDKCFDEGLTCKYGEEFCCGSSFPTLEATCLGGQWALLNLDTCLSGVCPACPPLEPKSGDRCSGLVNTETCSYGEHTCCGKTHPTVKAQCIVNQWALLPVEACIGGCPNTPVCPAKLPELGDACTESVNHKTCDYGSQHCCGKTHPTTKAQCIADKWALIPFDACLGGCADACPADRPNPGSECVSGLNDLAKTCKYGKQTCCGKTHEIYQATCFADNWGLVQVDACLACVEEQCPSTLPKRGSSCNTGSKLCQYGRECCHGQCYASYTARCSSGRWSILARDACFRGRRRLAGLPVVLEESL